MTIREVLSSLTNTQRDRLMISFDGGVSQVVEYTPGKFIAVHLTNPARNLTITARAGNWSIGDIRRVDASNRSGTST